MTLKAVIIDDEIRNRNTLQKMLLSFSEQVELAGMAENADEGISLIRKVKPDLVFLDIQMPGKTGFDMLQEIGTPAFEIIFTTAHDQFAIKAFKFSAVDYLLKPIDFEELESAIGKAVQRRESKQKSNIEALIQNVQQPKQKLSRLALPALDGMLFVQTSDIVRIESDGNYSRFYMNSKERITVSKTLGDFEELLSDSGFVRVHHSHLINLDHVKKYVKGEGGTVIMSDNSEVEVSRRKKEIFMEQIARYSGK